MFIAIPTTVGKNGIVADGKIHPVPQVLPDHLQVALILGQPLHRQPGRPLRLLADRARPTSLLPGKARLISRQVPVITGLQAWIVRTIPGSGLRAGITSTPSSGAGQVVVGAGSR
jgi:hypothetical protein